MKDTLMMVYNTTDTVVKTHWKGQKLRTCLVGVCMSLHHKKLCILYTTGIYWKNKNITDVSLLAYASVARYIHYKENGKENIKKNKKQ